VIVVGEETATQRHRGGRTPEGKYRVIQSVPVADKGIDEDQNENQRDQRRR